jgi:hypothetical protein
MKYIVFAFFFAANGVASLGVDLQGKEPLYFGYHVAPLSNVGSGNLGPYGSMSLKELKRRFNRPWRYKDKFARANSLSAILERRLLRREMTKREVLAVLGMPDFQVRPKDSPTVMWGYSVLSDFAVDFDERGRVSEINWSFEWEPGGSVPDYSRVY